MPFDGLLDTGDEVCANPDDDEARIYIIVEEEGTDSVMTDFD